MKTQIKKTGLYDLGKTYLEKGGNPADLLSGVQNLANEFLETKKVLAQEETKRSEIQKEKEIAIEKINATKEIFLTYLDKSFDERKNNFDEYFKALDKAIENDNLDQLSLILNNINNLAASSPFKDIVDSVKLKNSLDNNLELDI